MCAEYINSYPWEDEPDFKFFSHRGLPCIINRVHATGHLCGYVGVPMWHPLYGLPYCNSDWDGFSVDSEINIHGGVTYAGNFKDLKPNIKLSHKYYFFGFDCAHLDDYIPNYPEIYRSDDKTYRNFEYVEAQTRILADQLAPKFYWIRRMIFCFFRKIYRQIRRKLPW